MDVKDFKWIDSFDNGAIRDTKAYLGINNIPPNRFINRLDKILIDLEQLDLEKIKQKFPNAIVSLITIHNESKNSSVEEELEEDEPEDDNEIYVQGSWQSSILNIYNGDVIYVIESDTISVYYNQQNPYILYKEIYEMLPKKEVKPKEAEIKLVAYANEYYTISSKIKSSNIDINENYNDDFKPVFEDIVNFLQDRKSGLIILRGEKGTGKTSLIRYLISTVPKNYILVTNAVAEHLASPEFISFMLDHKDSVFILEDCEQILMKRTDGFGVNGAIANILNMSDGLMSDIFNVKFICTFNADIEKIDEALLRKGRCFANYEFKPLSAEKTSALLNKLGIKVDKVKEMTLADIYNYEASNYSENKPSKKIGF
jgi:predicted AAA+ superfamily ATPase